MTVIPKVASRPSHGLRGCTDDRGLLRPLASPLSLQASLWLVVLGQIVVLLRERHPLHDFFSSFPITSLGQPIAFCFAVQI